MKIEHINPEGLLEPQGYSHVVTATAGKTVYIAGQGAMDKDWKIVGAGDHYEQTKQAFKNLMTALKAAGATPKDIVKCTIYVVGLDEDAVNKFTRGMSAALDGELLPPTASTLVGVERLFLEEMLIEVDAIAVIDE